MTFVSWNVNGLRAICNKGFEDVFKTFEADFFCLQETKLQQGQIDLQFPDYESYWNYADKKGYSGTVTFTRLKPVKVTVGMGIDKHDHEGRIVTLEMEDFYLVNVYVPNSQPELARLSYRLEWEEDFFNYVVGLDKKKPVVICGDMNVAHKEIDLANPQRNTKNAGFTPEERNCFTRLLEHGFVDSFRYTHPDEKCAYTWWSYMFKSREKNIGWRIDYFVISERLVSFIDSAEIRCDITGSDHCPVTLTLK